jgi:hypothetical protein
MTVMMNENDTDLLLFDCKEKIIESYENFQAKRSGWNLKFVKNLHIHINRHTPMRGSSYMLLPDFLKNTKSIINIKNTDNKCFLWSLLYGIYGKSKNTERYSDLIQYENTLNMIGLEYPVKVTSFEKFENQNQIGINVYCYTDNHNNTDEKPFIYPIYISKKDSFKTINLLLLQKDDESHYCLIKNFNKLNYSITKHKQAVEFCMRYLSYFYDTHTKKDSGEKDVKTAKQKLYEHMKLCSKNEICKVEMPTEGSKLFFNKYHKQLRILYFIHCDFECLTVKMNGKQTNKTTKYQHHVPSQFGLYVISDDTKWQPEPVLYNGPDAHIELLKTLKELETTIFNKLKAVVPKNMTDQDKLNFRQNTYCYICNKPYTRKDYKVRDHDHISGQYRGGAHNSCNINYKFRPFIPVVFYNLQGYDAHFILQAANKVENIKRISVIPLSKEKYVSFSVDHLRFIDLYQFMSSSLETLTENLKKTGMKSFKHTSKYFPAELLDLVTRKGVCLYDYVDSFSKFNDTCLPTKVQFYSQLNASHISNGKYEYAQNVWSEFNCETLRDYLRLYLKVDVLLQVDVFETFRDIYMVKYGLDPLQFYTAPGFSWDALFKCTEHTQELMTNSDMYMFCEQGIHGGISMIRNRYSEANNPHMKNYDAEKPNKYIAIWDANNLYGKAMSEKLPTGNYTWLIANQINSFDIRKISENSDTGYIIECNLEYPIELHETHNAYPLAPENIKIT